MRRQKRFFRVVLPSQTFVLLLLLACVKNLVHVLTDSTVFGADIYYVVKK